MNTRLFLPAVLVGLSPAAHADTLSGWWSIRGSDKVAVETRKEPENKTAPDADGAFYVPLQDLISKGGRYVLAPEPGSRLPQPDSCGFGGQLMLREAAGEPTECTMTLTHRCSSRPPGNRLTVVQTCLVTREGESVTIRGGTAVITEAVPPHIWPATYSPDTFTLTMSADGKSMRGAGARKSAAAVSITRIADLVE